MVVVLEHGRVVSVDSPSSLLQNDNSYLKTLNSVLPIVPITDGPVAGSSPSEGDASRYEEPPNPNGADDDTEDSFLEDTRRKNGELSVYTYYLVSSGHAAVTLYAVSMVLWIFCTEFSSRYSFPGLV